MRIEITTDQEEGAPKGVSRDLEGEGGKVIPLTPVVLKPKKDDGLFIGLYLEPKGSSFLDRVEASIERTLKKISKELRNGEPLQTRITSVRSQIFAALAYFQHEDLSIAHVEDENGELDLAKSALSFTNENDLQRLLNAHRKAGNEKIKILICTASGSVDIQQDPQIAFIEKMREQNGRFTMEYSLLTGLSLTEDRKGIQGKKAKSGLSTIFVPKTGNIIEGEFLRHKEFYLLLPNDNKSDPPRGRKKLRKRNSELMPLAA